MLPNKAFSHAAGCLHSSSEGSRDLRGFVSIGSVYMQKERFQRCYQTKLSAMLLAACIPLWRVPGTLLGVTNDHQATTSFCTGTSWYFYGSSGNTALLSGFKSKLLLPHNATKHYAHSMLHITSTLHTAEEENLGVPHSRSLGKQKRS